MDLFRLTRQLVEIDSTTGREAGCGEFLLRELATLGYQTTRMDVEPGRFNVWAHPRGNASPAVVFCSHMDTVPPYFPFREDEARIWGRGACDDKGVMAAQVAAAETLKQQGVAVGLLFTVGEETDSAGAKAANVFRAKQPAPGSKFLINGEPTENKLAAATKGVLNLELVAKGKLAHSAYPELGESAIEKLLDALARIRAIPLPSDREIGRSTLNIGQISGGRAPNVVADEARAKLLFRMVTPADEMKEQIVAAVGRLVEVQVVAQSPFIKLRTIDGMPTMVASFSTDIPHLSNWGEPLLLGPGSIHVAHTADEHVEKAELVRAVELYVQVVRKLLAPSS
ncbi:MAG: M20/M25/M40 family metallo-hydrolase [Acidobacteriota bacterium]|nr:M20/M25/M40 family metallo-hydrolase [Acidobacteriota bacterium]